MDIIRCLLDLCYSYNVRLTTEHVLVKPRTLLVLFQGCICPVGHLRWRISIRNSRYHIDTSVFSGSSSSRCIGSFLAFSKCSIHLSIFQLFGSTSVLRHGISLTQRLCCSAVEQSSSMERIGRHLCSISLYGDAVSPCSLDWDSARHRNKHSLLRIRASSSVSAFSLLWPVWVRMGLSWSLLILGRSRFGSD